MATAIHNPSSERPSQLKQGARLWAALVVLLPVSFSLYLGLQNLRGFWDDAAITAAYARTYADSGRIALTPSSPTVEGMSSLTWFFLLTVPRFFSSNPDVILIWMKCASAVALVLALAVLFRVAREQLGGSERAALACTLMLAFSYTSFREVANGMEMNLAMLLVLLLFYVLTRSPCDAKCLALGWILATLLLATRFESPLLLLLLAVGLYFDGSRRPAPTLRGLLLLGVVTLLSFGTLELWRHHEFGVWMPNTVYAKEWPPYSHWRGSHTSAGMHLALKELLSLLNLPLLIALVAVAVGLVEKRFKSTSPMRVSAAVWMFTVSAFVTAWITGSDWGYSGRMIVPVLPFLLIALVALCRSALSGTARLVPVLGAMIVSQALILLIAAFVLPQSSDTVGKYRRNATGAEAIRRALNEEMLVVMLPDVGGSSLYSEHLRILDSALLSNPELSKRGWAQFGDYFRTARPDLFETHGVWATYQRAYTSDLLDNYSIVSASGMRFFVRNDLFARLLANKDGDIVPVEASPSCLGGPFSADMAFSRARKTCLVLMRP